MAQSIATHIIRALALKKNRQHGVILDTQNVFNLMVKPNLPILGTQQHIKDLPAVGSIVKIKTRFGLRSLVVVDQHPKELQPHSKIKMVFAASHEQLLTSSLIHTLKIYLQARHIAVPDIKPKLIAVEGYHFGFKNKKPYINLTKAYSFKVTNLTRHQEWMAENNSARVITGKGESDLVIKKIVSISDPKKYAQMKPVITFHNFGIKNHWLSNLYKRSMKK